MITAHIHTLRKHTNENTCTHKHVWHEWKGIDFFIFHKPVSFTEGGLWLLALPAGSSISVMGGCGGLHHVPVNFNHIKLSRPFAGMPALYSAAACIEIAFWIMCGHFMRTEVSQKYFFNVENCIKSQTLYTLRSRRMTQREAFLSQLSFFIAQHGNIISFHSRVTLNTMDIYILENVFMKTKSGSISLSCVLWILVVAFHFKLSSKNSWALPSCSLCNLVFPTVFPASRNSKSSSHHMG